MKQKVFATDLGNSLAISQSGFDAERSHKNQLINIHLLTYSKMLVSRRLAIVDIPGCFHTINYRGNALSNYPI